MAKKLTGTPKKRDMEVQGTQMTEAALKKRSQGIWIRRISAMMSALLACALFYVLMKPAITMENGNGSGNGAQLVCAVPEHMHTEQCWGYDHPETEPVYGLSRELECSFVPHVHDMDCYDETGELICGISERYIHVHDDLCYDQGNLVCLLEESPWNPEEEAVQEQVLICDLPETAGHMHTDACYTVTYLTDEEPVCGLKEGGHVHTEDCYGPVLICEEEHEHTDECYAEGLVCHLEEGTEHVHTLSCYPSIRELTCGLEETEGHVHDEDCYAFLTVEKEPHVHTEECYADDQLICGELEIRSHQHTEACWHETQVMLSGGHVHNSECVKVLLCGMQEHVHTRECYSGPEAEIQLLLAENADTEKNGAAAQEADADMQEILLEEEQLLNEDMDAAVDGAHLEDGEVIRTDDTEPLQEEDGVLLSEEEELFSEWELVNEDPEWEDVQWEEESVQEMSDDAHETSASQEVSEEQTEPEHALTDDAVETPASGEITEDPTETENSGAEDTAGSRFEEAYYLQDVETLEDGTFSVHLHEDEGVYFRTILEKAGMEAEKVDVTSDIPFLEIREDSFVCRFAFTEGSVVIRAGGKDLTVKCTYAGPRTENKAKSEESQSGAETAADGLDNHVNAEVETGEDSADGTDAEPGEKEAAGYFHAEEIVMDGQEDGTQTEGAAGEVPAGETDTEHLDGDAAGEDSTEQTAADGQVDGTQAEDTDGDNPAEGTGADQADSDAAGEDRAEDNAADEQEHRTESEDGTEETSAGEIDAESERNEAAGETGTEDALTFVRELEKVEDGVYSVRLSLASGVRLGDIPELEGIAPEEIIISSEIEDLETGADYFACRKAFEQGKVILISGDIRVTVQCTYVHAAEEDEAGGAADTAVNGTGDAANGEIGNSETENSEDAAENADAADETGNVDVSGEEGQDAAEPEIQDVAQVLLNGEETDLLRLEENPEDAEAVLDMLRTYLALEASESQETGLEEDAAAAESDSAENDEETRVTISRVFRVEAEETFEGVAAISMPVHARFSDLLPDGTYLTSVNCQLFHIDLDHGEILPVQNFEVEISDEEIVSLAFETEHTGTWVLLCTLDYAFEERTAVLTLDFSDFDALMLEDTEETGISVIEAEPEMNAEPAPGRRLLAKGRNNGQKKEENSSGFGGISIDLARLLEAVYAQNGAGEGEFQGIRMLMENLAGAEFSIETFVQEMSEGGVSCDGMSLQILDNGSILLRGKHMTLTIRIQGFAREKQEIYVYTFGEQKTVSMSEIFQVSGMPDQFVPARFAYEVSDDELVTLIRDGNDWLVTANSSFDEVKLFVRRGWYSGTILLHNPGNTVEPGTEIRSSDGAASIVLNGEAVLPEGTELTVQPSEGMDIRPVLDQDFGENADVQVKWFDISLGDVHEIQAVVTLHGVIDVPEFAKKRGNVQARVYHAGSSGLEVLDAEVHGTDISFVTNGFSEFAVAYTVDFHWEMNGETYEFTLPGGGAVSLTRMLSALGFQDILAADDSDDMVQTDAGNAAGEETVDGAVQAIYDDGEDSGNESEEAVGTETDNGSDRSLLAFAEQIQSVSFSDPALVWTGKAEMNTTVGQMKENNALECNLSSDMTEDMLEDINRMQIAAGDWALISLMPFTSEESLTVTMKNGDVFVIRVTDAQVDVHIRISDKNAGTFSSKYFGLDGNGNGLTGQEGDFKSKSTNTLNYGFTTNPAKGYRFAFWVRDDGTIDTKLTNTTSVTRETTFTGYFAPKDQYVIVYFSDGYGNVSNNANSFYDFSSNDPRTYAIPNYGYRFLGWYDQNDAFISPNIMFDPAKATQDMIAVARFRRQGQTQFNISVNNSLYGDVTYQNGSQKLSYCGDVYTDIDGYLNHTITAEGTAGYTFSHWELNGVDLGIHEETLQAHNTGISLKPGDHLKAVFVKSTVIEGGEGTQGNSISDSEKRALDKWLEELDDDKAPLQNVDKTSQVYDYEKRIYEVTMTAESSKQGFDANIDLAFILDASASMNFPSKLKSENKDVTLTQSALDNAYPDGGIHYFISDPQGTSTVYRIFKDWGTTTNNQTKYGWCYSDASQDKKLYIENNLVYKEPKDSQTPLTFPMYYDADSPNTRLTYLNSSLSATMEALRKIAAAADPNRQDDDDIYVAYNTFAFSAKNQGQCSNSSEIASDIFITSDFQKVNGTTTISVNVPKDRTTGGTRQDLGLKEAKDQFSWNSPYAGGNGAKKYAILISDGASVSSNKSPDVTYDSNTNKYSGDGRDITKIRANVTTQANALKAKGVTLITVGLSTKNVVGGSDKLSEIADSIGGVKQFYDAETGDDLKYILLKILETIMADATVEGDAADELDPAFYPVNQDGTPVKAGYYYPDSTDAPFVWHQNRPGNENETPYYEWINNAGNWTISWHNQDIGWAKNEEEWKQTFYVKAKEDFLGGNTIKTNNAASVTPKGYKFEVNGSYSDTTPIIGEAADPVIRETPIVNVKELSLNGHDATWTVYLGAPVTDDEVKEQIRRLFDNIEVSELVKDDGTPVVEDTDIPVTFPLKNLTGGSLTDEELENLLEGTPVTRKYNHYDHSDIGEVTIHLQKEVQENGDIVYTLTASYASRDQLKVDPDTGASIDWHNGPNGPGRGMRPITSSNTQTIDDYYLPQAFQVKKVDENGNPIDTSTAMFKLYRKAKPDTDHTNGVSLELYDATLVPDANGVGYFLIDTVHTGRDGIARIAAQEDVQGNAKDVSLLLNASDGPYYLVETGAPMGYTRTKVPTVITVTAGPNQYTTLDGEPITLGPGQTVPNELYNMTQGVTITVAGPVSSGATIVDASGNKVELEDGEENDRPYLLVSDTSTTYQTSIKNDSINDEGGIEQVPALAHKKQIDYLGDKADNPDTTADNTPLSEENSNAINDLYRLYLDVGLQKTVTDANIVLIADYSYSMGEETMGGQNRLAALKEVLTKEDGFISSVLTTGSGNQMTVIKLANAAETKVLQDWASDASTVNGSVNSASHNTTDSNHAINYEKALDLADAQIQSLSNERKDKNTYVIFISDGLPTGYLNKSGQEVGGYESMTNPPAGLDKYAVNGQEVIENLNVVLPNTIDAVGEFRRDHKNINICAIGIGSAMDTVMNPGHAYTESREEFQYPGQYYSFILNYLGRNGYQTVTTKEGLLNALNGNLQTKEITELLIQDELSEYVALYTNQPDFVVTKTSKNGTKTDLAIAYDEAAKNYKVLNGSDEIGRLIIDGKKITLDFKDDLSYDHGDVYTLSFNVQAADKAYEDYTANKAMSGNNGYGTVAGDAGTDYNGNTTSSEKPGFYSNTEAHVSFKVDDKAYTPGYDKPVIQVGETKLEIEKVWSPAQVPAEITEVTFTIKRDGNDFTTITVERSANWKMLLEHLIPKKLTQTSEDSNIFDKNGQKLKKTVYVPYAYTVEEDLSGMTGKTLELLQKYDVTYEYTATETADRTSFTNPTSKYEGGVLVYYIPASGENASSDRGKVTVTNTRDRQIILKKVGENNTDPAHSQINLGNAEFTVYEEINGEAKGVVKIGDTELSGLVSDSETGKFFEGRLLFGTYLIRETKAPSGYNSLIGDIRLNISEDGITVAPAFVSGNQAAVCDVEDDGITIHIVNTAGTALPSTGGPGTNMLYLFGVLLTGLAGAGLVVQWKKRRTTV